MPPKKKKSTPIVVGTVSTRSTRRESIVNIEIIPKASKSPAKTPVQKKAPKKSPNSSDNLNTEQEKVSGFEKTSPEILEILKDWSDDENSQGDSLLSISSSTRSSILEKNDHNSSVLPVDQQSLIDILEGNHSEHHSKSMKVAPKSDKFTKTKDLIIENPIINIDSPQIEESEIIEECVVEDDSIIIELPEEQMDVIAQEQNSELNVSIEDLSMVDNKLGSPVAFIQNSQVQEDSVDCTSNDTKKGNKSHMENTEIGKNTYITNESQNNMIYEDKKSKSQKDVCNILQEYKQSGSFDGNLKLSSSIDEENQSMTSEDTTSQSMITVQDEDTQMSDNSTNNYEIIEEQVVFDSSEAIIVENLENVDSEVHINRNFSLKNNELILDSQEVQNTGNLTKILRNNDDSASEVPEGRYQDILQEVASSCATVPTKEDLEIKRFSGMVCNKNSLRDQQDKESKKDISIDIEAELKKNVQSNSDSSKFKLSLIQPNFTKSDSIPIENCNADSSAIATEHIKVVSEVELTIHCKDSTKSSSVPISSLKLNENNEKDCLEKNNQQSIQITSLETKENISKIKNKEYSLNSSKKELPSELEFIDTQSEEIALCQKMNEQMDISKESNMTKDFDPASEKLQEGIQKMHINENYDQKETTRNTVVKKEKSISSAEIIEKEIEQKEAKSTSKEEKQKGKVQTLKSKLDSSQNKERKSLIDSDLEKSPKSCHDKLDTNEVKQRRRSTRRKQRGDETQPSNIVEQPSNLQNLTGKGTESEINCSFGSSLLDEQSNKHLRVRSKKFQKKGEIESDTTDNDSKVVSDAELDPNKDAKTPKNIKGKLKKALEKHSSDVTKIEIDSESSEAKTSEAEGDSTSNESSQSSNFTKIHKTRAKKVSLKQAQKSNKMNLETNLGITQTEIKSHLDLEITAEESNQNKKSKGTKTKAQLVPKKAVDEELGKMVMDLDTLENTTNINILRANIDATIDDVLRKYTQDELDIYEESTSPKEYKSKVAKPFKESKKKKEAKPKKDDKNETSEEVRRSDRIKTILPIKKKSHGLVRSKSEPALVLEGENLDTNLIPSELDKPVPVFPQLNKKTKSRAKSSENLQISSPGTLLSENTPQLPKTVDLKADKSAQAEIEARLKSFIHLKENQYKTDRQICKEAREMICDCYLAEEDIEKDEYGCGEDCLNRLLMIECGDLCQIEERCTNKRFQKGQVAPVEVFKTEKKGLGLIAAANIPYGEFILEYIGEVLNPEEFDKRAEVYSKDKNIHFYFMSLRADAIIDATMKGNISRFINHSCDPNAETQKWTVNGELRIGFFSTRTILAGEEITFDYKFQRYGKEAQKCYCGAATCRGWLGERPDESEDEDEEEEEEEETQKVEQVEMAKAEVKIHTSDIPGVQEVNQEGFIQEKPTEKMEIDVKAEVTLEEKVVEETPTIPQIPTPKKASKKKLRKELLYEDFDQLNEDIEMVVTTGLKNQAHTLKLSRLMVRAKDLDQRKKLLRVLRRGELPCRRLFLDYHGLRLMHGYMIDAQQLTISDKKSNYSRLDFLQTKLELLQTLAVLPIQNKTMLIESKVLPAVEKWAKNEDLVEDGTDQKDSKNIPEDINKQEDNINPTVNEKIDEIKFLASKLLEEWVNLKQSFKIPKKQRIEQMKEHEKEANRKFMESSYAQEKESSRKNDQRYRTWSRYKSERETNKKGHRAEDKERPSAEFLKMSKHERRKLFALQMELKEEERRLKQREMWRQHEMNCMMIGADPRFTAPFDPNKGFQYIWNPSIGQWQALPVPPSQNQGVYNSPATPQGVTGFNVPSTSQGVSNYNVPPPHKSNLLGPYPSPILNVPGIPGPAQQYPAPQKNNFNTGATTEMTRGLQPNMAPMVPGLPTSVAAIANAVPGMASSLPGITGLVPGVTGPLHGISGSAPVITGSVPGITQPPLPALPIYQEVKQVEEDPSQVKFAGPIPPPVKLPPKWKCAKDKYGRPYYYHVKIRKSQWEPPPLPEEVDECKRDFHDSVFSSDSSSSETSSLSSSDTSSDSDTDDEIDDTKLLMEVRKQMESTSKFALKSVIPRHVKKDEKDSVTPSPEIKNESDNEEEPTEELKEEIEEENTEQLSSIDIRLKEQFNLDSNDPPKKKRRIGLCQEIIISPRTEEDRQQFKEDLKRYKATKEKLKRQKEQMIIQAKKKLKTSSDDTRRSRDKRLLKNTAKSRMKQMNEWNDEHAKKIKEVFRSTMATTVVGVLNAYRKPDCKESRITNTEDFKHLARKLTHFVMLKEMKHINTIEELICTDNVKAKAREYIKKYMSKFGEVYQKRQDEPDFKD